MSALAREPLSLRFANTRYAERGRPKDTIETPELLGRWLADELGPTEAASSIDQSDVIAFTELRTVIRELFAAGPLPHPAPGVALLNKLSAAAPRWPALEWDDGRFHVVEHCTVDARATLAQDAIRLLGGELRNDLRSCQAPGCVLFFVKDHPRREWCSTACGNRARAARHYLRHHGGS